MINLRKILNSWRKSANSIGEFAIANRGNVALTFALLALPMMGLIGAGTDITRASLLQSKLQEATDAAVLSAVKTSANSSQITKDIADSYLHAHLTDGHLENISTTLSNSTGANGKQLNYVASASYDTTFLKAIGRDSITVSANSSAAANNAGAEVVFVLDTTASMAENNKMENLKSAVDTTLQSMLGENGANVNNVKIGVVPFNVQVKITPEAGANYIDWGDSWTYQDCDYNFSNQEYWPQCEVAWRNLDIVCYSVAEAFKDTCRASAKYFDKPVYTSNGKYYYEQWVKAYVQNGSKYNVYTHKMVYWWTDSSCQSYYTDETGTHCGDWGGGSSDLSTDSQTNFTNHNNLNQYNNKPGGFNVMNKLPLVQTGTWDGYGANPARDWDYTWYNENGRNVRLPASTDQSDQWTGCVIDRAQDYDTSAESPSANIEDSLYPARPCNYDPLEPVLPLTTDIDKVRDKVDALEPAGYTNITIGIQWGMEVLSPDAPFTGAAAFGTSDAKKYMVIITDGYNNQNRFSNETSEVDKRTEKACEAAKAKGITLFVVRLEDGDSSLLKKCASQPPYYYDLESSSQLSTALSNMFTSMSKLRLVN